MMKFIIAVLATFTLVCASDPTDMDSLFQGREYKPELSAALRDTTTGQNLGSKSKKDSKSNEFYMLQFEAVADFDAAQRRKAQLAASTGYTISVVFDTPFYKLRGGGWSSKKAAEDKARELAVYNINAFVVKIR